MIFFRRFLLFFAIVCAYTHSMLADDSLSPVAFPENPVEARLVIEEESLQPGRPFWVAVHLKLADDWHSYWKNPGIVGFPTSITWDLPAGFQSGDIHWPFPEKLVLPLGINYGYTKEVWLLTEMIPPETLAYDDAINLQAVVHWLVCSDDTCLPGETEVSVSIPVKKALPQPHPKWGTNFVEAREKLPEKTVGIQAHRKEDSIQLLFPFTEIADNAGSVYFCPATQDMIDETVAPEIKKLSNYCVVTLKASENVSAIEELKGTLVYEKGEGPNHQLKAWDIEASLVDKNLIAIADTDSPSGSEIPPAFPAVTDFEGGFGLALLFAFMGGFLLNLMPCVLPVISLKIFSFVKMSGEKRSLVMKHGLLFSLGVLVSFWVLAGLMLILQAYGQAVGWGFQLQEPLFVAVLSVVLLVFGLSFFGVFEIGLGLASRAGQAQSDRRSHSVWSSFFSGVLATAVATPCTGPFLGSAIGFAVTLSAPLALLIFTALGLGMAFPYLLLSASPSLIRYFPKPGPWMETFKELMGFFMFATCFWLVWVFASQTNLFALFLLLGGFLGIAFSCWIYGKWATPFRNRNVRLVGTVGALVFGIIGCYAVVNAARFSPDLPENYDVAAASVSVGEGRHYSLNEWEPFSKARLLDLRRQHVPVLIDFTAKWCLICQTNHLILSLKEVSQKLEAMGVVKMEADWTKSDPVITEELRKFGRNGVPLYVLYSGDPEQEPIILPQVLTPDTVLEALQKITQPKEKKVMEQ